MKVQRCVVLALLLFFSLEYCLCARILGLFPINSKSHRSIWRRIMTTLASRGHQVTVLSRIEETQTVTNYTHILLKKGFLNCIDSHDVEYINITYVMDMMRVFRDFEISECSLVLSDDRLKTIISSKLNAYDLIFTEDYYVPCYLTLAAYLKVPVIWFLATSSHYPIDYFIGNPHHPAYFPLITSGLSNGMSFIKRLMNVYQMSVVHYYQVNVFVPQIVDQFNKQHNANVTLEQIYQLPNLALICGHFTLFPRPNLPNVVEIGGVHIEEEKSIPKDIYDFIEKAEYGVVFFSFGTTLKCSSISEKKMKIFKEVFSKIQQRVFWRCDVANHVKVSDNVMIRQWLPQRDILAHRNVLAFISHGGLLGTYEAIYTATPLIGIPFFYDQETDVRLIEKHGAGIYLNYRNITADVLLQSIDEIINNSKYKENMERLSVIFKDRPMSPLDTAMYWTEYVIRHKGAPHLRSPAAGMPLYRYLLLDVIGFLAVCILLTLYIASRLICKLSALVFRYKILRKHSKEKSS